MIQIPRVTKPDTLGAAASGLCAVHCIATPLLFIANTCAITGCVEAPIWWKLIDYFFLVISFVSIQLSIKNSTKSWVGFALFGSWTLLLLVILNESFEVFALPEVAVYIPALSMIALHLFNQKYYCKCADDQCCSN